LLRVCSDARWGVLVLVALSNGTMRWGEIRRWVKGVTEKMLGLTGRGRELTALLLPLVDWVTANTTGGKS
jgi:DNA-binding HxlR family transcriptional regulator